MNSEIKSAAELEEAIDNLKQNRELQKEALANNFNTKIESLKPASLFKSSVADIRSNKGFQKKAFMIVSVTVSMILLKKMFAKRPLGAIRMMLASAVISGIVKTIINKKSSPST